MDEARYRIFCQKGQKNEILPPTSDSLALHMQRANYQTYDLYGDVRWFHISDFHRLMVMDGRS